MAAWPGSLGQQRREALDPPVDGDVSTSTPRSANSSSTSRYDSAKRRYQRTASTITSGGKQKPANAARTTVARRGRRVLLATVCLPWARSPRMHAWLTRCRCRGCTCSMMADALGGGWCECCPVGGLSVECPRRCPDPAGRLIEACLHPTPACAPPPPAPPSCSGGDQGVAVAGGRQSQDSLAACLVDGGTHTRRMRRWGTAGAD